MVCELDGNSYPRPTECERRLSCDWVIYGVSIAIVFSGPSLFLSTAAKRVDGDGVQPELDGKQCALAMRWSPVQRSALVPPGLLPLELGLALDCYYDQLAGERVADLRRVVRGTSRTRPRRLGGPGASAQLLRPVLS